MINKAKLDPIKTKIYIGAIIIVLLSVLSCILMYRNIQDIKNKEKIQKLIEEKKATEAEVQQWKNKINEMNADFVRQQKQLSDRAVNIRNNTKPTKLPKYEKPVIRSASYNTMLDSLLVAQPD
jgi:uridine kinase